MDKHVVSHIWSMLYDTVFMSHTRPVANDQDIHLAGDITYNSTQVFALPPICLCLTPPLS